jgi:hypothetical protein
MTIVFMMGEINIDIIFNKLADRGEISQMNMIIS